jgi:H2-forming N5,N10-methylenetetrahydromethanopterin dehydrogenase-like enzyme
MDGSGREISVPVRRDESDKTMGAILKKAIESDTDVFDFSDDDKRSVEEGASRVVYSIFGNVLEKDFFQAMLAGDILANTEVGGTVEVSIGLKESTRKKRDADQISGFMGV